MFPEASMLAFPFNDSAWMTVEFVPLELRPRAVYRLRSRRLGPRAVNERLYCVVAPWSPATSIWPDAIIVASFAWVST